MPIFLLGFCTEGASPSNNRDNVDGRIRESLAALDVIASILDEYQIPATFFVLGRLLDHAGSKYAKRLGQRENFDIQSHAYSHHSLMPGGLSLAELDDEMKRTNELIKKFFDVEPIGLKGPGGYYKGMQGYSDRLKILWNNGMRFLGADSVGPPGAVMPALFTQHYWYEKEGFPELLEIPATGFHCTYLLRTIGDPLGWKNKVGFATGEILEELPNNPDEQISVRQKEFQYAIDNDLVYAPSFHPWSIYRFDEELRCLRFLVQMARDNNVPIKSFKEYYLEVSKQAPSH